MRNIKPERWKSVGKPEKVGKYRVQVGHERSDRGNERFRVKCVKERLTESHPNWARKVFSRDTEDKTMKQLAYEHAFKINDFLIHGDPDNINQHENEILRNIYAKMKGINAARKDDPTWMPVTVDDLDPLIDTGIKFQRVLKEHVNCSLTAGIEHLQMKELVSRFAGWLKSESAKLVAPTYGELIEKCLADKLSPTGGVKGKPMSIAHKARWNHHMRLADGWFGHLKTSTEKHIVINACRNGIKCYKSSDGKPWEDRSKNHAASTMSQFGLWLADHGYISDNIFKLLVKKFRVNDSAPPKILLPSQVARLFEIAANNPKFIKLIPHLVMLCGTGCRPSESATDNDPTWPKSQRRYQWKWANGWAENLPSEVTGGIILHQPEWADAARTMRASKTPDRMHDMPPNFFAWLKWYYEDVMDGELPTTGQMWFSGELWDQLREAAGWNINANTGTGGEPWPHDATRNSFTSYANANAAWKDKASRDYWQDACGHSYLTFKRFYKRHVSQAQCLEYFNILPPKKKAPPVKGQGDRAKAASQSAASA